MNGNIIRVAHYDIDELLYDEVFEYDDQPSAPPYTHFGLQTPGNQATANNVRTLEFNSFRVQVSDSCPCDQVVKYDDLGRPSEVESNTGYYAIYHY